MAFVRVMISKPLQPKVKQACVSLLVFGSMFLPLILPSGSCKVASFDEWCKFIYILPPISCEHTRISVAAMLVHITVGMML